MSSNIRVEKICQHCKAVFVAKTTKTKFCSVRCAGKAYKIRKREEKLGIIRSEVKQEKQVINKIDIQDKDILKVSEASILVGCSTKTIYRLIKGGEIKAHNFSQRITRISRSEINKFLEKPVGKSEVYSVFNRGDYYTITELQERFKGQYSKSSIFEILKAKKVTKISKKRMVLVLKEEANNALN